MLLHQKLNIYYFMLQYFQSHHIYGGYENGEVTKFKKINYLLSNLLNMTKVWYASILSITFQN